MSEEFINQAKQEAMEAVENQRRQYELTGFAYCAADQLFYEKETRIGYEQNALNALIPRDSWEVELVPGRNGSLREVKIKPSSSIARIERGTVVEGTAWWPGMPPIIHDIIVKDGADYPAPGCRILNMYEAPRHHAQGNAAMAGVWVSHLKTLYPEDAELMLDYFAHTVQHPEIKINFGLVLIGEQGIGKDSALLPVRAAVGERNCAEISPDDLFSQYNNWAASVLLIINEARPAAEDFKATHFYELLKTLTAAPPNWLRMNEKYGRQRYARNLMRVIITTNDLLSLYVPENDRRLHFAQSKLSSKWAEKGYFDDLHKYFEAGGLSHVYAYLRQRDISKFDPKQKPAANDAFKSVSASWNAPVHDPLADVLDELGWPDVFFGGELLNVEVAAFDNKDEVKLILRSSRKLAAKMDRLGYEPRQAPEKSNGWKFSKSGKTFRSRVAFVKKDFAGNVEAEVQRRGDEIAANGRAARPKVVKLELAKS